MKHKTAGQHQSHYDNNGFVLTLVVLIIGSLLSIVVVSTSIASISELQQADVFRAGVATEYAMEGCVDEALLQLARDDEYSGGEVEFSVTSCTITISGVDNERTITVEANHNNTFYKTFIVEVTIDPFDVLRYDIQ